MRDFFMEKVNAPEVLPTDVIVPKKVLECSSKGDKRFSALFAYVNVFGKIDSIENWYQMAKRVGDTVPTHWKQLKGQKPTHIHVNGVDLPAGYLTPWYKYLWLVYLDAHPNLVAVASQYDEFNDIFRGKALNCQADVIKQYVKSGRESLVSECADFMAQAGIKLNSPAPSRVHIVDGDLLDSDCTVIGHQANCFSTMGTGIAKSIRTRYPEAYAADKESPLTPEQKLGNCTRVYVDGGKRIVANLYGQFRYGRDQQYTDYNALESALIIVLNGLAQMEAKGFGVKFGLPYNMGCANAGGDWNVVLNMLERLANLYNRDIYVYKLAGTKYTPAPTPSGNVFKLVVAGGRDFSDYALMCEQLDRLLSEKAKTHRIVIVSGKAKGADSLGERYAQERGYDISAHPANWDAYGKSAGYKRNVEMANEADAVVAFWDTRSVGTKHMIDIANERGKPLRIINY